MRCAQRGCALPLYTPTGDGALCPVCHNPLIAVLEDGDDAGLAQLAAEAEAQRAAEAEAAALAADAARVSQEQPTTAAPVLGADGLPIPATA